MTNITISTNYVKGLNQVDPMPIDYSQDSINLSEVHQNIRKQMEKQGWDKSFRLDVVLVKKNPQKLVSIDNRRLYLAKMAKLKFILVNVHLGGDIDIQKMKIRFEEQYPKKKAQISQLKNWKDCIKFRVKNQSGATPQTKSFAQHIKIKVRKNDFSADKFWQQLCSIEID